MEIVKLFIEDAKSDVQKKKTKLREQICCMNDKYKDLEFEVQICNKLSKKMLDLDKKELESPDAAIYYVLFEKKIEEKILQNAELVLDTPKDFRGNPIYIHCYTHLQSEEIGESVENFLSRLDAELNRYCNKYAQMYYLNLNLILELVCNSNLYSKLEFEDDKVMLKDLEILDLENFPDLKRAWEITYEDRLQQYQRLLEEKPGIFELYVAIQLSSLGDIKLRFMRNPNRHEEAEKYYRKSQKLYQSLAEKKSEVYELYAMQLNKKIWSLLEDTDYVEDMETGCQFYKEDLQRYRCLAKKKPEMYEAYIPQLSEKIWLLLMWLEHYEEAETYYQEALENYKKLVQEKPEYQPNLAKLYVYWAGIQSCIASSEEEKDYKKISRCFQEAAKIYIGLAEKKPEKYQPNLADSYKNLGELWVDKGDYRKAEQYYKKSLKLYEGLAKENFKEYNCYVLEINRELGDIMRKLHRYGKAKEYYSGGTDSDYYMSICRLEELIFRKNMEEMSGKKSFQEEGEN